MWDEGCLEMLQPDQKNNQTKGGYQRLTYIYIYLWTQNQHNQQNFQLKALPS